MFDTRLASLQRRMTETSTDLVVLGPTSHMKWLTGLSPHGDERPVMVFVSQTKVGMLIPALNVDSQRPLTTVPFFPWRDDEGPSEALQSVLNAVGASKPQLVVAVDEAMRTDFALLVLDALPGARRTFTKETVSYLRAQKSEGEYRALKDNALINDGAMRAAFASLRAGITELEVADVVRAFYKSAGASTEFISVCFGQNGAFPHHHTGDTALQDNQAVLIDIGGRSQGYPSDMTRVGFFGAPTVEFNKVHGVVEAAVQAALEAAKPGVEARVVDQAARGVIEAAGYGDLFLHRTGHGLGIDIHEEPNITATSNIVLREGNVFSIEPGIYFGGQFGVRLEEIVILRADGPEVLSELSRDPIIV